MTVTENVCNCHDATLNIVVIECFRQSSHRSSHRQGQRSASKPDQHLHSDAIYFTTKLSKIKLPETRPTKNAPNLMSTLIDKAKLRAACPVTSKRQNRPQSTFACSQQSNQNRSKGLVSAIRRCGDRGFYSSFGRCQPRLVPDLIERPNLGFEQSKNFAAGNFLAAHPWLLPWSRFSDGQIIASLRCRTRGYSGFFIVDKLHQRFACHASCLGQGRVFSIRLTKLSFLVSEVPRTHDLRDCRMLKRRHNEVRVAVIESDTVFRRNRHRKTSRIRCCS